MAATVLSGTGNVSYTNNTGQNVRIVTNYLKANANTTLSITVSGSNGTFSITLGGGTDSVSIGRGLSYAYNSGQLGTAAASVAGANQSGNTYEQSVPTEIALENAQTYSITKAGGGTDQDYNLLVIPESG